MPPRSSSVFRRLFSESQVFHATSRLHPDRVAGRHRHHRRPDRPAAAGRAGGPRGGPAVAVRQQPEADRPGPAQLPRRQRRVPDGLRERRGSVLPNTYSQSARTGAPRPMLLGDIEQGRSTTRSTSTSQPRGPTPARGTPRSTMRRSSRSSARPIPSPAPPTTTATTPPRAPRPSRAPRRPRGSSPMRSYGIRDATDGDDEHDRLLGRGRRHRARGSGQGNGTVRTSSLPATGSVLDASSALQAVRPDR